MNTYTKSPQKHTQLRTVPYATHNHTTPNTYSTAQGCRPTWGPRCCGTILGGGGGGAVGPLVGSGARIAGGGQGAPQGRQQLQQHVHRYGSARGLPRDHPSRNWEQGRGGGVSRFQAVLGGASAQRFHDGREDEPL